VNRAIAIAVALAACNQRDQPRDEAAKTPAPAPAVKPVVVVPPDATDDKALEEEAARMADMLTSDDPSDVRTDDQKRRPGADLAQQIEDAKHAEIDLGHGPAPAGRITATDKQDFDDSTLTADQVLATIAQKYMVAVKGCYTTVLHRDPTARGKLKLALSVSESGRVAKVDVESFDPAMSSCVEDLAGRWRFPVPKDKDGETMTSDFRITFQMVPD